MMLDLPTIMAAAKEEVIIPSSVVLMETPELLSVVVTTTGSTISNSLAYLTSEYIRSVFVGSSKTLGTGRVTSVPGLIATAIRLFTTVRFNKIT